MTTDPAQAAVSPTDALVEITFSVWAVLTRVAAEHDVSMTQLRAFGILRDRRPRMAQLAEVLGLEKSTMSGLVGRAERRGLVRRMPSGDDGRASEVVMTDAGQAVAAQVEREIQEALAPILTGLGPAEVAALRTVVGLLRPGLVAPSPVTPLSTEQA